MRVSDATSDVSTGGVGGGGWWRLDRHADRAFHPEPRVAGHGAQEAKRALPREGHRDRLALPGRSIRVRFLFVTTKSWAAVPRLRTTKRTVDPAGTLRRDSENAKSRASTEMVNVRAVAGAAAPASATAPRTATDAAMSPLASGAAPATVGG